MRDGGSSEDRDLLVAVREGGTSRRRQRARGGRGSVALCATVAAGAIALLMLVVASPAGATFAGRNGVLLVSSHGYSGPPFTTAGSSAFAPLAHSDAAGCDVPSELWGLRPDGSHPTDLGRGDTGMFSPGGRRLAIYYRGDPAYFEGCGLGPPRIDPRAGPYLSRPYAHDKRSHRRRIMAQGLVGWLPGRTARGVAASGSASAPA